MDQDGPQLQCDPWGGGMGSGVAQAGGCLVATTLQSRSPSLPAPTLLSSVQHPTCLQLLEIRLHSQKE